MRLSIFQLRRAFQIWYLSSSGIRRTAARSGAEVNVCSESSTDMWLAYHFVTAEIFSFRRFPLPAEAEWITPVVWGPVRLLFGC